MSRLELTKVYTGVLDRKDSGNDNVFYLKVRHRTNRQCFKEGSYKLKVAIGNLT